MRKGAWVLGLLSFAAILSGEDGCEEDTGLVTYTSEALDGYTLMSDGMNDLAVLINMDGKIIKEWPLNGFPAKMLPGGHIISGLGEGPVTPGESPEAAALVQLTWDGATEWSFTNWDDAGTGTMMARQHHDFQREGDPVGYYSPNQTALTRGKTLVLVHKNRIVPEISDKEVQDDVLIELNWDGSFTGFEWRASDHVDEFGFDEVARTALYQNPNYDETLGVGDWLHINSASYLGLNHWWTESQDPRFDPTNIIISSRNANFIAIISRTTGNVLWRVGPDFSDGKPEAGIGQLQGQHHAHMIPDGLPGAGNILLFDNGGASGYGPNGYPQFENRGWSRVVEFDPLTKDIVWEFGGSGLSVQFYSTWISSAQRLPNGNTLITSGEVGRTLEVTPDQRIVWDFFSPTSWWIYRAYRVPPEWLPKNAAKDGYQPWSGSSDRRGPRR